MTPFLTPVALLRPRPALRIATLHSSAALLAKSLPPRRVIPESEIVENFLKGSGRLIHIPTGIVVKYQDTRSRELNRKTARRLLQDRLEELELGEGARTRVKAREKSKKKASSDKKKRRKYRALEAGKEGEDVVDEDEGPEGGDHASKLETVVQPDADKAG
ncbi:hypothetical protein EJ07DRAFT_162636 [Lizonia empirigonia]|nr:hypothetical protein EJ07DRAFT_162636 [Lizonia empirigonia]